MTPEEISRRVDFFRANIATLEKIPQTSFEEFCSDFRNRAVHLYDRIDPKIVYRILSEQRKDLTDLLDLLLGVLDRA